MADIKDLNKDKKKKPIPKVIELNPSNVVGTLEQLLEMAKAGSIDSFVFAGFTPENLIVSSKADVNVVDQQHLVAFLQTETTLRTITESLIFTVGELYGDDDDDGNDDDE